MRLGLVAWMLWGMAIGSAQEARHQPIGTVTGHVICADTQRPARLAEIRLVKLPEEVERKDAVEPETMDGGAPYGDAVESSLDGGYTIRNVKPGEYFVVVDKEGYLLPLAMFTAKELAATDDKTRARIGRVVHTITVNSDQTVMEDVRLERGASVSGVATYDDGTPAAGLGVKILQKGTNGKWIDFPTGRYRENFGFNRTDDKGHYRIVGLPAGQYVTEIDLTLSDHETTFMPVAGNKDARIEMHSDKTRFSLPLYSGDKLRRPMAEPYTLGTGEERTGADVVFPLAKLHRVSGHLLAKDGHALNGGTVDLIWADDGGKMTEAAVQYADRAFHLEFVPEGEFTLKSRGVQDVTRVQVENLPGFMPRMHEETRVQKTYADTEQPLIVEGEMSDVSMVVPEAKATK